MLRFSTSSLRPHPSIKFEVQGTEAEFELPNGSVLASPHFTQGEPRGLLYPERRTSHTYYASLEAKNNSATQQSRQPAIWYLVFRLPTLLIRPHSSAKSEIGASTRAKLALFLTLAHIGYTLFAMMVNLQDYTSCLTSIRTRLEIVITVHADDLQHSEARSILSLSSRSF
ncbi:hypothetical protein BDZ45DRAFT_134752 [Acephala macrosclerotiorum]|nr:hypothetical protein BDZ45DRAFT_134752 [Acephala macrosclerotiorum]